MEVDQRVSSWEIRTPLKGAISLQLNGTGIDGVVFHRDKDGFLAKTAVEGNPDNAIDKAIDRVNRALDKIAFETGASIRIEESGIIANRRSEPIGPTTGEMIVSMARLTIKLKPSKIGENTVSEAATLGSDIQDATIKRAFQKSLSHYRNGINAEYDGNPKAFLDFWNSIEVIASKYGKGSHIKDKIYDCFGKSFGERKEDGIEKLYDIRLAAAHGLKDVSDPEEIKIIIGKTPQMRCLAKQLLISWSKQQSTQVSDN